MKPGMSFEQTRPGGPGLQTPAADRGVAAAAAFFALSGVLEILLSLWELPAPPRFWPAWEAVGRGVLHFLLAAGLWSRFAFCRSVAMVYCLAALVTYAIVLVLALGQAPLRFPASVVVQSLFQIPSCALLLPYLRSAEASRVFRRPLI
jgi:hypothetical protein